MHPITSRLSPLARASARSVLPRAGRRFASTETTARPADHSHALAGLAGGGAVLLGIYGYYHYSGTAAVVKTARSTIATATSAKDSLFSATPSTKEALGLLRSAAKTYAVAIPGAGLALDKTFDQLERLGEEHGDEVIKVVKKTLDDIKAASLSGKDGGEKIMKSLGEAVDRLSKAAGSEGGKVWETLVEKYPDVGKALGSGGEELQKLGEKHGPEARRIALDAYSQASSLVAKGGINAKTLEAIKKLVTEKTDEVSKLAKESGSEAWEASAKAAGPWLEKMPSMRKVVEESLGKVSGLVGEERVKVAKELYAQLEKVSKSGKSTEDMTKEAKKIVEAKVGSLGDLKEKAVDAAGEAGKKAKDVAGGSGGTLASLAASVPGLGGLGKILEGSDLKHLRDLAEKHGEKGEKVLESTYEEIKHLLAKKVEEAKKVAGDAAGDVQKESSK